MSNGINQPGFRLLPSLDQLNSGAARANTPGANAQASASGYAPQGVGQRPVMSGFTDSPLMQLNNPHFDAQNLYGGMKAGNPYVSSDDHLLATALSNSFSLLDKFTKDGSLDQAGLKKIADEDPNLSTVSERTIMLANEIINRPRLNDAILGKGGKITPSSLSKAASTLLGNTNPNNTKSADPFHAKTDAQVVEAFRGMFDELRDRSEDRSFFFEKHRYVKTDKIIEMSKDPNLTDEKGALVRDPDTGFAMKKYSPPQVYMAKNLVERPGLLASLDSNKANGTSIFGSHNSDGWLKNYSLDRWLENDKKEKGK